VPVVGVLLILGLCILGCFPNTEMGRLFAATGSNSVSLARRPGKANLGRPSTLDALLSATALEADSSPKLPS
jgi:hypothetical protein